MNNVSIPRINNKLYRYKPIPSTLDKNYLTLSEAERRRVKKEYGIDQEKLNYVIDEIVNKRLFLSNPDLYNDPFDSTIKVTKADVINRKYHEHEIFYLLLLADIEISNSLLELIKNKQMDLNQLVDYLKDNKIITNKRNTLTKLILAARDGYIKNEIYPKNIKIACFSESVKSIPMWSYYASNHSGVCLEYNFENLSDKNKNEKFIKNNIFHVIYSNFKSNKANISPLIKSVEWEHENEWRLITYTKEDYINVPRLSAIYFGVCCVDRVKNEIINAVKLRPDYKNIKLYQMSTKLDKFELEYKEIEY